MQGSGEENEKAPTGKVYKFNDLVEIEGTEKAKHLKTGKKYKVHRLHADKMIKGGWAKKA